MEDGPRHPGVHFPPPLLFLIPLGLGAFLQRRLPLELLPDHWRTAGVLGGWLLIGFWALLSGWAFFTFTRQRTGIFPNRPATRLVTWGPYGLSRNPMYVSLVAVYFGATLLMNNLWPLIGSPLVVVSLHFLVIRREERYLAAAFPQEYAAYCASVRRWL
jgi:protein-S-isoprenylcysteine O-methyltransferase Ste14